VNTKPGRAPGWRGVPGLALGVLATAGVLWATVSPESLLRLREVRLLYLLAAGGMVFCSWACAAGKVWMLCRSFGYRMGFGEALTVTLATEFGIAVSPAGVGGSVMFLTLLKRAGIPLTVGGSMLAVDVAVDLAFFAVLAPFALATIYTFLEGAERYLKLGALSWTIAVAGVATVAVVLVAFLAGNVSTRRILAKTRAIAPGGLVRCVAWFRLLRSKAGQTARLTREAGRLLLRDERPALWTMFLLAASGWLCRYAVLPLILLAFSARGNPFSLMAVQGFLFGMSLMLVLPGGGGSIELVGSLLIQPFVPLSAVGLALLLWRFLTFHLYLFVGGAVFLCFRGHLARTSWPDSPGASSLATSVSPKL
jgi:uncharacterized protein (TIRG00374 family)